MADAKALAHAGCFAIVLEGVPDEVARMVTDAVDVPTIGIGAGPGCDGQVLVFHDVLGIEDRITPKFVRRYAVAEGRRRSAPWPPTPPTCAPGAFPADDESYHLSAEVAETLGLYGRAGVSARPAATLDHPCGGPRLRQVAGRWWSSSPARADDGGGGSRSPP